ncbi:MAG TPA: hypothetical protein VHU23_10995 [Rhizomicrobium sp.]|jgi:hypothetical protein|nr:hypothetical protein [Rhizomicrobium sp.]
MKRIDLIYVLIGVLYLTTGMTLGIVMGMRHDFQLEPVHAHINLVGFVAHSLFGLMHRAWPSLRTGVLAMAQFWFFVLGSPVFLIGITLAILAGNAILAIIGSILLLVGALLFLAMLIGSGFAAANI